MFLFHLVIGVKIKWCRVIHPLGILTKRLPTPSPKVIMVHLSGSREIGFGRLIPCQKSSFSYGSATIEAFQLRKCFRRGVSLKMLTTELVTMEGNLLFMSCATVALLNLFGTNL